jgi:hypothetical protein
MVLEILRKPMRYLKNFRRINCGRAARIALRLILLAPPIALAMELGSASAQLPATNPLVVPPLPPGPPAQLPAPISTAVAPSPVAVPTLPAAYSTPGSRSFNCSCAGPGTPVHWMGEVTAISYSSAEQSATGACVGANQYKPPSFGVAGGIGSGNFFGPLPGANQPVGAANTFGSPGVSQSSSSSTSLGSLPGAAQGIGVANSFGAPSATLSFTSAQQARLCSKCVCN